MQQVIFTFLLMSFTLLSTAQVKLNLDSIQPNEFKENVTVLKLKSDKHQSSFLIWVVDTVKPHYHKKHTETIYVLQGSGLFYLGKEIISIKKGDYLVISEGEIHSFKTTSDEKVKVLSIQTPEFLGKDRIWTDKQ